MFINKNTESKAFLFLRYLFNANVKIGGIIDQKYRNVNDKRATSLLAPLLSLKLVNAIIKNSIRNIEIFTIATIELILKILFKFFN